MNKTVSINLSGQVFQIDEQAYEQLRNYLESIRRRFATSYGGQEIIADIEARIAEMFNDKLSERKQVITLADVQDMMQHMGKPEDFDAGVTEEDIPSRPKASKRLFKNPDDKIIGGVCSGISAYFGIEDPLWIRLAFVFAFFFGFGSPVLIYIILWIIVPEAVTASEKLQMKGENINISNIEKTITQDLSDLKMRIQNINSKDGTQRARNFFERAMALFINIVAFVLKVVLKFTAALLVVIGLAIIFSLLVALAFPAYVNGFTFSALHPLLLENQLMVFTGILGVLLLAGIPALSLALAGFHLLLNNKRRVKGLGVSLFGLWLLGMGLVVFTSIKTASDFRTLGLIRPDFSLEQPAGDTIYIESKNESLPEGEECELFDSGIFVPIDSEYIASERVRLNIVKSSSTEFQLIQEVSARGSNKTTAVRKAESVIHHISQSDTSLVIGNLISFPAQHHFRGQMVKLTLKVPEGKSVFIDESLAYLLDDVQNVTDTYDPEMAGHTWTMLPEGLTCADCESMPAENNPRFPKGMTREFDFKDFTAISATGAFNIKIMQGDEFKVVVDGSKRFTENIEIEKGGSKLGIKAISGGFFGRDQRGTVHITLPELHELKIAGANQSVISGFKGDEIRLEVSGASGTEIESSFKKIEMEVKGASSVSLAGSGEDMKAVVSGASKLKAFNYEVKKCDVDVNGASKAEVNASDELKAEANGASEILYKGLPEITSDVTGFSSMKPNK